MFIYLSVPSRVLWGEKKNKQLLQKVRKKLLNTAFCWIRNSEVPHGMWPRQSKNLTYKNWLVLVDNFFSDSNTARESVSLLKSVFRNSAVLNEGQNMTASKIQLFCHLSSLPPYHNLKDRVTSDFFKHPFSARAVAQYYFLFFLLFFFLIRSIQAERFWSKSTVQSI